MLEAEDGSTQREMQEKKEKKAKIVILFIIYYSCHNTDGRIHIRTCRRIP
jgi:hypothetical protein